MPWGYSDIPCPGYDRMFELAARANEALFGTHGTVYQVHSVQCTVYTVQCILYTVQYLHPLRTDDPATLSLPEVDGQPEGAGDGQPGLEWQGRAGGGGGLQHGDFLRRKQEGLLRAPV